MLTTRAQRWLGHIPNLPVEEWVGTSVPQLGEQGSDLDCIRGRRQGPFSQIPQNGSVFLPGMRHARGGTRHSCFPFWVKFTLYHCTIFTHVAVLTIN